MRLQALLVALVLVSGIAMVIFGSLIEPATIRDLCNSYSASGENSWCSLERFEGSRNTLMAIGLAAASLSLTYLLFIRRINRFMDIHGISREMRHLGFYFRMRTLRGMLRNFLVAISEEDRTRLLLLLIIFLSGTALRIYFLAQPMQYDESYTYTWYVSKPFIMSQSVYREPNNHLLHTFLAKVSIMAFGDSVPVLRLPAFLAGLACIVLAYHIGKTARDGETGLVMAALFSFLPVMTNYSVDARGYSLIMMFSMLAIMAGYNALKRGRPIHWVLAGIFSALSIYTIPSMAYFFVMLVVAMAMTAHRNRKFLAKMCCLVTFTAVLTFMFYMPVIIVSGIGSLIGNKFVQPLTTEAFPAAAESFGQQVLGIFYLGLPLVMAWLILTLTGMAGISRKGERYWRNLSILVLPVMFLPLMFQRIFPPGRTMLFMAPLVYLMLSTGITMPLKLVKRKWASRAYTAAILAILSASILIMSTSAATEEGLYPLIGTRWVDTQSTSVFLADKLEGNTTLLFTESELIPGMGYYLGMDASTGYFNRNESWRDSAYVLQYRNDSVSDTVNMYFDHGHFSEPEELVSFRDITIYYTRSS
jgi:hypothetical protein